MNRSELRIGDAVEVCKISFDGVTSNVEYIPATVCGTDPLSVAYANGEREAPAWNVSVRRPLNWSGK